MSKVDEVEWKRKCYFDQKSSKLGARRANEARVKREIGPRITDSASPCELFFLFLFSFFSFFLFFFLFSASL